MTYPEILFFPVSKSSHQDLHIESQYIQAVYRPYSVGTLSENLQKSIYLSIYLQV